MGRERHAVAQLATGGSCIDARPIPVGMPWPLHPLGLACVEAVSAAVDSPVTSSALPRMWCMRRMRMVRISRPSLLLLWLEQQRIRTEAIDADTTISVSIGARSGGMHSVLQLVQPQAAVAQWGSDVGHSSSPAASALPSIEPLLCCPGPR